MLDCLIYIHFMRLKPNVLVSIAWIKQFCDPSPKPLARFNSYGMKHRVEEWAGHYVSNDDFIEALVYLGLRKTKPRKDQVVSVRIKPKPGCEPFVTECQCFKHGRSMDRLPDGSGYLCCHCKTTHRFPLIAPTIVSPTL